VLDGAVFHCQQAAEMVLKGYLTWHDQPFRKTHNLEDLVRQCERIDAAFVDLVDAAKALTPYAGEFRYPGDEDVPSIESTNDALAFARQVVQFVTLRLPPEASA
jgi:HEPN domain-containing protein